MRNKLLYLILVLPFFMSSCNEWLNVEPEDEITEEELFTTGNGFRHALNGIYYSMESKNLYGKQLTWGVADALGQVYVYNKSAGVNEMQFGADEYKWDHYALKPVITSIWQESCNIVANCNNLVQQIEHADPEIFSSKGPEKAMIWGEALALRAFIQFDMLRLFAPAPAANPGERKFIPYVDTYPSYVSNPKTVNECLDLIAKDLKEAKQLLWKYDTAKTFSRNDNFEQKGRGEKIFLVRRGFHLNYWAATALLARVYLYAQKEDEALEQASEVIDFAAKKGAFAISDRFSSGDRKCYSDVIFGLHVIDLLKYNSAVNTMENEDKARYLCISEVERNYFGRDLYEEKVEGEEFMKSNDYRFTRWIEDMNNRHSNYRFRKYDAMTSGSDVKTIDVSDHIVPFIRMSEMYYTAAEILCKQGGEGLTKAKTYLSYVKQRRGLKSNDASVTQVTNASADEFIDILINDMRREWIGEGQTYFIYKRLNRNIPKEQGTFVEASEKVFVAPVPDIETNIK